MILSSILNYLVDHQSGGVTTFNTVSTAGVVGPFHGAVAEEGESNGSVDFSVAR